MEKLDGDTVRLSYRGVAAERDIVQVSPKITPHYAFKHRN